MANTEQVDLLHKGVDAWNDWRRSHPDARPDLSGADLKGLELRGAALGGANLSLATMSLVDLREADLRGANLTGTELELADLSGADLNVAYGSRADCRRADFRMADLSLSNFSEANLTEANMAGAVLQEADFSRADFSQAYARAADFTDADLSEAILCRANFGDARFHRTSLSRATTGLTVFSGADLSSARDLGSLVHIGPSSLDASAILQAGELPSAFRMGVGLEPSFSTERADCYIAFAGEQDADIARRFQVDLQTSNVRSWLFSENEAKDESLRAAFVEGVRGWRKAVLLLSGNSVQSESFQASIGLLIGEEARRGSEVFLPVVLDDKGYEGIPESGDGHLEDRTLCDFRGTSPGSDAWQTELAMLVDALYRPPE